MNPDTVLGQCFDSCPDIHRIAPKAVELGDNEDVSFFESVKELGKGWTCGCLGRAADALRNDSLGVNVESCRFDFLNLIVGGLIGSGDAAVSEETGHGQARMYENDVRIFNVSESCVKLCFGHAWARCP